MQFGSPHAPRGRHSSGFTLVELLVVIAIIAILASILFPVFARARENARRSACQSNIRFIGIGISQYVQDFDERYPMVYADPSSGAGGWVRAVQPYLKSVQMFQCPADSVAPASMSAGDGYTTAAPDVTDYFYNANVGWDPAKSGIGRKLSDFTAPVMTILTGDQKSGPEFSYADAPGILGGACTAADTYNSADTNLYRQDDAASERHLGGANYAFVDGHVKWLNPGKVTCAAADGVLFTLKVN